MCFFEYVIPAIAERSRYPERRLELHGCFTPFHCVQHDINEVVILSAAKNPEEKLCLYTLAKIHFLLSYQLSPE